MSVRESREVDATSAGRERAIPRRSSASQVTAARFVRIEIFPHTG